MAEPPQPGEPNRAELSFPPGTIVLIIEDENIIAWDVEALFRQHGAAEVLYGANLRQAREHLRMAPRIDLALLDLRLGGGESGEELIGELRGKGIAIILTTGYAEHEGGDLPTVRKPYDYSELLRLALDTMDKRG